jgi:kynurenine formamidase
MRLAALLSLLLLLTAACAAPPQAVSPGPEPQPAIPSLDTARVVDLTYAYDENTVYWPTDTDGFRLEQLAYGQTEGGYFYAANAFCTAEHGGTHLDAPIHFAADGWTNEAIPLDRLIGPAMVIDVTVRTTTDPDYALTPADVTAWEAEYGAIPEDAIVVLRTGWGRYWPDRKAYLGDDTPGDASNLHFPSYGREAADLLVDERHVAALGVDTASIDLGTSTEFWVHRDAFAANVAGLENLAHVDELPATGAWVIALPMKIAGGSGGPTRIIALLPR